MTCWTPGHSDREGRPFSLNYRLIVDGIAISKIICYPILCETCQTVLVLANLQDQDQDYIRDAESYWYNMNSLGRNSSIQEEKDLFKRYLALPQFEAILGSF